MLKFGIVGCGHVAKRHAEQMAAIGELIAVCDIDGKKAFEFSQAYNAKSYTDLIDLLNNERSIDVIAICTPNFLHAEQTITSLRNGFHVVCEKPMSIKIFDCELMIEEAKKSGKKLFVVKQNRFNPPVQATKKLLDEKKLGKIYSVHLNCIWNRDESYYRDSLWKGKKNLDGGILYTQFSHFIDLLYWMFGDIKIISAYIANNSHKQIEFEDSCVASAVFDSGVLVSMHFSINSFAKNMEGSLTIIAENGTIKIGGEYLNKLEYQNIKDFEIESLDAGNPANDYGSYKGSMSNHDKFYKHISDVLTNGAANEFDGSAGLETVRMIEKIYRSANEALN